MLTELEDMQQSDESVRSVEISFDIESRCTDGDELVQKTYTFSYASQFDTWTFQSYTEKRTKDTVNLTDRDWSVARDIYWNDKADHPSISVPTEITDALADATGADEVNLQTPASASIT